MSNIERKPFVKIIITIDSKDGIPIIELEYDGVISWSILKRIFFALIKARKDQIKRIKNIDVLK